MTNRDDQSADAKSVGVTIEIPRWSFVKYALSEEGGHVEFISPFPCPFNYGFVEGLVGGDNLPLDAIVLGPRVARTSCIDVRVRGVVRFVDNSEVDDKLVCANEPLSHTQIWMLRAGFRVYVVMKRIVNRYRGRSGQTHFTGIDFGDTTVSDVLSAASK